MKGFRKNQIIRRKLERLKTSGSVKTEDVSINDLRIELQKFDKKIRWATYRKQFVAKLQINGCSDFEKATALIMALRGEALGVPREILDEQLRNLLFLIESLEMRYYDKHL